MSNPEPKKTATLIDVRNFFGMKTAEFRDEWTKLSPESRKQISAGIGDGSFSY